MLRDQPLRSGRGMRRPCLHRPRSHINPDSHADTDADSHTNTISSLVTNATASDGCPDSATSDDRSWHIRAADSRPHTSRDMAASSRSPAGPVTAKIKAARVAASHRRLQPRIRATSSADPAFFRAFLG